MKLKSNSQASAMLALILCSTVCLHGAPSWAQPVPTPHAGGAGGTPDAPVRAMAEEAPLDPAACFIPVGRDNRIYVHAEVASRSVNMLSAMETAIINLQKEPLLKEPATMTPADQETLRGKSVEDLMRLAIFFHDRGTTYKQGAEDVAKFIDGVIKTKTAAANFPPFTTGNRIDWEKVYATQGDIDKLVGLIGEGDIAVLKKGALTVASFNALRVLPPARLAALSFAQLSVMKERMLIELEKNSEAQIDAEKKDDKLPFKFEYTAPTADEKKKMLADEARDNCDSPQTAIALVRISRAAYTFSKARGNPHSFPVKLRRQLAKMPSSFLQSLALVADESNPDSAEALTAAIYRTDFSKLEENLEKPKTFDEWYLKIAEQMGEYHKAMADMAKRRLELAGLPVPTAEQEAHGLKLKAIAKIIQESIPEAIKLYTAGTHSAKARDQLDLMKAFTHNNMLGDPAVAATVSEELAKRLGKTPTGVRAAQQLVVAYDVMVARDDARNPSAELRTKQDAARRVAETVLTANTAGPHIAGEDDKTLQWVRFAMGTQLIAKAEAERKEGNNSTESYERARKLLSLVPTSSPQYFRALSLLAKIEKGLSEKDLRARALVHLMKLPVTLPSDATAQQAQEYFQARAELARYATQGRITPALRHMIDLPRIFASIDSSKMSAADKTSAKVSVAGYVTPWLKAENIRTHLANNTTKDAQADADFLINLAKEKKYVTNEQLGLALQVSLLNDPKKTADAFVDGELEKDDNVGKAVLSHMRDHIAALTEKGASGSAQLTGAKNALADFLQRMGEKPRTVSTKHHLDRIKWLAIGRTLLGEHDTAASLLEEYPKPNPAWKTGTNWQKEENGRRSEAARMRVRALTAAGSFDLADAALNTMMGVGPKPEKQTEADFPFGYLENDTSTVLERGNVLFERAKAMSAGPAKEAKLNEAYAFFDRLKTRMWNQMRREGSYRGELAVPFRMAGIKIAQVYNYKFPTDEGDNRRRLTRDMADTVAGWEFEHEVHDYAITNYTNFTNAGPRSKEIESGVPGYDQMAPMRAELLATNSPVRKAIWTLKSEHIEGVLKADVSKMHQTRKDNFPRAQEWAGRALFAYEQEAERDKVRGWTGGPTKEQFDKLLPKEGPVRAAYERAKAESTPK